MNKKIVISAVKPPSKYDVSVFERIVRGLQDSPLHLFGIHCFAADPKQPHREDISIPLSLTCVTDGRRGFLVLAEDFAAPESEAELLDFMEGIYNGLKQTDHYVVAVAGALDQSTKSPRAVDLRDATRVRERIEEAYDQVFHSKQPIEHEVFFQQFAAIGIKVDDEATCRGFYAELDAAC